MSQYGNDADLSSLAAIGVGGNVASSVGCPKSTILAALSSLHRETARICAVSRFYRTPAFPAGSGPDYVNAAAILRTRLSPDALLGRLHETEAAFGRQRAERWGPRTLDLDLLFFGDIVLPDAEAQTAWRTLSPARQREAWPDVPILPHPRIEDRAFVLVPLAEIAPGWRHPLTGHTVAAMAAALGPEARAAVKPI